MGLGGSCVAVCDRPVQDYEDDDLSANPSQVDAQTRYQERQSRVRIAEENYQLRNRWPVPTTLLVSHQECMRSRPQLTGRRPQITMSEMTTADALLHFGRNNRCGANRACALNFANGEQVGGGYKTGAQAQEEDLCRRMPNLYTSLLQAKNKKKYYPYGPCTCLSREAPERYSDVLFTLGLVLARDSERHGFELFHSNAQVLVGLVSAAAPNVKFRNEIVDRKMMYNTIKSIFIAPKLKAPNMEVLILGAWGCGAFGGDPHLVSELFVHALCDDSLAQLYKEIHFAIPTSEYTATNHNVFRQALQKRGLLTGSF